MSKNAQAQDLEDQPHTTNMKAAAINPKNDKDGVTAKRLRSFIERVERLEEEKAGTADDIKEVYAEAKGTGFEPKIMRRIVKLRKMDPEKRREENELLDLYSRELGLGL